MKGHLRSLDFYRKNEKFEELYVTLSKMVEPGLINLEEIDAMVDIVISDLRDDNWGGSYRRRWLEVCLHNIKENSNV